MRYEPLHHTIVAVDVVGSGSRDDQLLLRMRADLRVLLSDTLAAQSVDLSALETHDLGDGLRILVPSLITPRALLDPFIPHLDAALREHRKAASEAARIRLRVVVHHGLVHNDGHSAGEPLKLAARLLDAEPVRRAVVAAPRANLVLVVSQAVYDSVVRHGYGLDQDLYQRIDIREKETVTTAWIYVPGYAPPILSGPEATADGRAQVDPSPPRSTPPAGSHSEVDITGHTVTINGNVSGAGMTTYGR